MLGAGLMDEVDMNNCGDVFDHIDDLMNFPSEDTDGFAAFGGDCDGLKDVWPAPHDAFKKSGLLSGGSGTSELPSELYVPYDDIVQLEWLSNFVEDSFSTKSILADKDSSENGSSNQQSGATNNSSQIHNPSEDSLSAKRFIVDNDSSSDNNSSNNHSDAINNSDQFHSTSPVSVLESSSSTSEKTMVLSPETAVPGRARSKRPRPVNFSARSVIPLISPTSSITSPSASITSLEIPSEFENFAESQLQSKTPKLAPSEPKKKKKKVSPLPVSMESSASPRPIAVRKCLHCEITKTPQWRAGPMGPKTLCNACGVRYKSGRLFPEYRPAASPTFVPTIHSNSHKKVLEMRCKDGQNLAGAEAAAAPELIPNRSHFLDYM